MSSTDSQAHIVQVNSYLTLHYRIQIQSGSGAGHVFIDTFGGRPATLQLGVGQWAPGMEEALLGRPEGDCFTFEVTCAQAYGDRNPELIQRVTRAMLAEHAASDDNQSFTPGDMVNFTAPNGGQYAGVLKEINDEFALFDFNHPLAGRDLKVDVDLLGVL